MSTGRKLLGSLLFAALVLPAAAANVTVTLFSGGYLTNSSGDPDWRPRIGAFSGDGTRVWPTGTEPTAGLSHAEAQLAGIVGADFDYSADVTVANKVDTHLQFRIADEGRYGVRLQTTGITFYEFKLLPKAQPCTNDPKFSNAFTHCPNWTAPDAQDFIPLREVPMSIAPSSHHVTVHARGPLFAVELDGKAVMSLSNGDLAVGRLGLYVFGDPAAIFGAPPTVPPPIVFSNIVVSTNPVAASNFALLYSTVGYEATAKTKRALVRTLNDVPDSVDFSPQSRFALKRSDGRTVATGLLNRLPGKTFGMQLWEADFGSISAEGTYSLSVNMIAAGSGLATTLQSQPFKIGAHLVSQDLLKPMSLANAEARRGADEDFWRNWITESGSWRVGVDGAFIADRADAGAGDTLTRVFDTDNAPLDQIATQDFRFVGRMTIVSGCDAQMRFEDAFRNWWAVTLQAGDPGGCAYGSGPGAVRLSVEDANGLRPLMSTLFPVDHPFVAGRPYDVEILVRGSHVDVFVDNTQGASVERHDVPVLSYDGLTTPRSGRFGLKAWASTARFEDVQAWKASVQFQPLLPGSVRIPTFLNNDHGFVSQVACQYAPLNCGDASACRNPVLVDATGIAYEERDACNPVFGQLHGFHDSSSQVGEADSHGAFLSGLMQIWRNRASGFAQGDRESLRRAIVANVLYLHTLFEEGGQTGQFAHSEMGRVAVDTNLGPFLTEIALYGLSDFGDSGVFVDRELATRACAEAGRSQLWLWPNGIEPILGSVVYARLARCVAREAQVTDSDPSAPFFALAAANAGIVLTYFENPANLRDVDRDTGRVVPWFEGVYEVWRTCTESPARYPACPLVTSTYPTRAANIAAMLVSHLTQEHLCDEVLPVRIQCPANGFYVLPQASGGDVAISRHNWVHMNEMPKVNRSATLKYVHFYNVQGHFEAAAIDAALLARMSAQADPSAIAADPKQLAAGLDRIVTGNLYWPLGLNPGIPADKIVGGYAGGPWGSSSFLYRHTAPFARQQSGFRVDSYTSKGWLDPWEDSASLPLGNSPHREAWRIDPQNRFQSPPLRSYLTFVNGHVIWDDQWDYWNNGENGWLSGETFIIADGMFPKAALLLEDGLASDPPYPANPYDTKRVAFFDTTHVDREETAWGFDDPDWIASAYASRAIHEFCTGKGFPGGRFTGHHLDERLGGLCVPESARFFDATVDDVRATGWDFGDINATPWAQVARAATGFCTTKGYVGGFFTGHQLNGLRGVVCVANDVASWYDSTEQDLYNSGEGFADVNSVPWAKAARAATNICLGKGYSGGFFTGHQLNGLRGVVCLSA